MSGLRLYFGGGLNESQVPSLEEAATGSYNFDLAKDSYKLVPRAPFDLKGTAPNAANINGLLQLVKRDNTETTLVQAGNTIYRWDGSSTFTSAGTISSSSAQLRDTYWSLGDYLVITDIQKACPVSKWDGTTFSTLSTGLGSTLYAKYGIVHQGRVWLFNVTTSSDTPHLMVASAFENPQSYDTTQRAVTGTFSTGLEAFYMLSPDLRPINGAVKTISGDLVISTVEGALFVLSGTSASTYKWDNFYPRSNAVGNESMVATGNDVMYMRNGGNIESLAATQKYGDVEADDLSRWIQNTVKADWGSTVISVYDQTNQKVLFFLYGKILVFFKDIFYEGALSGDGTKKKLSPWSVYKILGTTIGTSAARFMRRPGTTNYSVYFGFGSGRVYDLNGTGPSGDGGTTNIPVVRITRPIEAKDGIDLRRHILRGVAQYRRVNTLNLNASFDFGDEYSTSLATIPLKGEKYLLIPVQSDSYATTPDSANNSISGDLDIQVLLAADNWKARAGYIVNKNSNSFTMSYYLYLSAAGVPALYTSSTGSSSGLINGTCTTAISQPDGVPMWLRATLDVDDGAGNHVYKFYTATNYGSWTQLGNTVTTAGTTSIADTTVALEVGGTSGSGPWPGKIYKAYVFSGIDGTLKVSFDADDADTGSATWTSASTGEAWTLAGGVTISGASAKIGRQGFDVVGRGPSVVMTLSTLDTVPYQLDSIELN